MDTLAAAASPDDIALAALRTECRSVAFTYNDPVIFHEYAVDTARACRARGVRTVAVTAGYVCADPRAEMYALIDAANVDLKAFTEEFYYRQTKAHIEPVKETLVYLKHETRVWLEITTLLIPGLNDSSAELERLSDWIASALGPDVPLHFSAFHPDYKLLDRPPTPPATLTRAREIARKNGLRYVYTGNVHDIEGGSTYCHGCGCVLIERDWYRLGRYALTDRARCSACDTPCAGVFEAAPGHWGPRRLPVHIH